MPRKKHKPSDRDKIVNSAIGEGISNIIRAHPRFSEHKNIIAKHIDMRRLGEKAEELYQEARNQRFSNKETNEYVHKEILDYIATGAAFDEKGKEIVLRKGLEEKAKKGLSGMFARRQLKGEKYLDNVVGAFQEIYQIFKGDDARERMPELTKSVYTIYELGFLDPALDVLKEYGIMNRGEYSTMKRIVEKKTRQEVRKFNKGIEAYLTPQKIAASVLLLLGMIITIFSSFGLTGSVISNVSNISAGIFGGVLILVSLFLFFKAFKK